MLESVSVKGEAGGRFIDNNYDSDIGNHFRLRRICDYLKFIQVITHALQMLLPSYDGMDSIRAFMTRSLVIPYRRPMLKKPDRHTLLSCQ